MKLNKLHIILILFSILFLQGCKQIDFNVERKITVPVVKELPIEGTWKIVNYIKINKNNKISEDKEKYSGKIAAFDRSIAVMGQDICDSPEYKVKNVSADKYFSYRYKTSISTLGISNGTVHVISITSKQQPFYDLIKIDDNTIVVYENQGFLFLRKVSNEVDSTIKQYSIDNQKVKEDDDNIKEDPLLRSGALLGLRSEGADGSSYRTLWIASNNKVDRPVYEMKQLLVPRVSGFWEVGYLKSKVDGMLKGTLYAHSVIDNNDLSDVFNKNILEEDGLRNITFVGNDYIGTEYKYTISNTSKKMSRYEVLPIDNVRSGTGIKIWDIAGENGKNALIRSSQAFILSQEKNKAELIDENPEEDNFSLWRLNGHWIMRGRLNSTNPTEVPYYEDFNIYLSIPSKLINYDKLNVAWNEVKAKVPEAIDVYTSPNKDLALIITKNSVDIYTLENAVLSEKPLRRVKLKEGEVVVMAEWAIGEYMRKWEEVIKARATEIKNNF